MFISLRRLLFLFGFYFMKILKAGPIPKHVAFIMDGNRRYSEKKRTEKTAGHSKGFDKLIDTLKWSIILGVTEVTYYAFSIDNFKRNEKEVNVLLGLITEKFRKIVNNETPLTQHGVRIRIIGDSSRLPEDLQLLSAEIMRMTRDNNEIVLNIAVSYNSREELTRAMRDVVKGVERGDIEIDHINEHSISECLYTHRPVDLLIRTSGEVRFSDFLMWQSSHACLYFTKVLWPEFSLLDFTKAVFRYQRSYADIKRLGHDFRENSHDSSNSLFKRKI